eukprot:1140943-Pelagomonas_calceolata.AAC.5
MKQAHLIEGISVASMQFLYLQLKGGAPLDKGPASYVDRGLQSLTTSAAVVLLLQLCRRTMVAGDYGNCGHLNRCGGPACACLLPRPACPSQGVASKKPCIQVCEIHHRNVPFLLCSVIHMKGIIIGVALLLWYMMSIAMMASVRMNRKGGRERRLGMQVKMLGGALTYSA